MSRKRLPMYLTLSASLLPGFAAPARAVSITQAFATGGTAQDVTGSTDRYHSFTTVGAGSLTFTTGGNVDYLVVAGGGGGGGNRNGGGGGAGGLLTGTTPILNGATPTVTVGIGGVGTPSGNFGTSTSKGGNSVFGSFTASGGGRGGRDGENGENGGSGGGGTHNTSGGTANGSPISQGNNGGAGNTTGTVNDRAGGGGGGAGGPGTAASNSGAAGVGGAGLSPSIAMGVTGVPLTYATGGNGGARGTDPGQPGPQTANTGNGGTGATGGSSGVTGGNGGSGIVIVRYAAPNYYWDLGAGLGGGNGTWAAGNWTLDVTGAAATGNFVNTLRTAVFDSTSASTVTVAGETAAGIEVLQNTVTFTGTSTNLGSGTANIASGAMGIFNADLTGNVTVASGGILGGMGMITGNTTVSGRHEPGNSPAIQPFAGNLTYNAGSSVEWELIGNTTTNAANPNAIFDTITVSGNLNFAGPTTLDLAFSDALTGGSNVDWTDTFWATSKLGTSGWLLYDVSGSTSGFPNLTLTTNGLDGAASPLSFNTALPGSSFSLFQDGSDIYLNYNSAAIAVAVPEPGSLVVLAVAGALNLRRRRRLA